MTSTERQEGRTEERQRGLKIEKEKEIYKKCMTVGEERKAEYLY